MLVVEQIDGGGRVLDLASFNLSDSSDNLFKAPSLTDHRITLSGPRGQLITSMVTGYNKVAAMVYQRDVTFDKTGEAAFINLSAYLTRSCRLSSPPLSTCPQSDLKLTAVYGTTAFGDCYNQRYQTAGNGFIQIDLSSCPESQALLSQEPARNDGTDRSLAPGALGMDIDGAL